MLCNDVEQSFMFLFISSYYAQPTCFQAKHCTITLLELHNCAVCFGDSCKFCNYFGLETGILQVAVISAAAFYTSNYS